MPAITATTVAGDGRVTATETTLNGTTDALSYVPGNGQVLVLRNATAGALTPSIGSGLTNTRVPGIGPVSVSAYAIGSIAAGAVAAIPLDSIGAYLAGATVSITGGTGLVATLYNR
ncbi:MAG: hypothetical protein RSE12_16945 [Fuscovulum sp.]|nr:MAG: hypothetical protein RSE12_16945 [Fuscovulum sp.]